MMMAASEGYQYYRNVTLRNNRFAFRIYKKRKHGAKCRIVGMIRLRDEEVLLQDTLDHLAQFVDGIVVFDDASSDKSVEIARGHEAVIEVIVNKKWKKYKREWEETANRTYLLSRAKKYDPEWLVYIDADERLEGDIRYFLQNAPSEVDAVRVQLFDAYITNNDKSPFTQGNELYNFRTHFGIERRDIIMIWRNKPDIKFIGQDQREPKGFTGKVITDFYCQHYGKSLSIEHWEETCQYYINNFPKYRDKWRARVGKAIHTKSDFDTKLLSWDAVKNHGGTKI